MESTATLTEPWMQQRIAAELGPLEKGPESVHPFPELPLPKNHFVVGADKLGVLWSLDAAFVDGPQTRVLVAVRFHEAATHLGQLVHGGAISAVIDAFTAACGVVQLGGNLRAVTRDLAVRFLRPVRLEVAHLLIARSRGVSEDGSAVEITAELVDEAGTTRAEGTSTMVVPKDS